MVADHILNNNVFCYVPPGGWPLVGKVSLSRRGRTSCEGSFGPPISWLVNDCRFKNSPMLDWLDGLILAKSLTLEF